MKQLPKQLSSFIWHFIKKQWGWFALLQVFCFGWSLDQALSPYVFMLFIDVITNFIGDKADVWAALTYPLVFGFILWFVVEASFRLSGLIFSKILPNLESDIRMSMFDYVQRHSYTYFNDNYSGSISNKIADMPQSVTRILESTMALFIPVILSLLISSALFARIQPLFAAVLIVWTIVHIWICFAFSKKCDKLASIHSEAKSTLAGKIVDSLTNNLNVKLFSRYGYEFYHLLKSQNSEKRKHTASLIYIEKMKFALGVACFLGAGVAQTWLVVYSWQKELLTTGEVVFVFNTTWNISIMVWQAGLELPPMFKEVGVCRQALSIIQDTHGVVDIPNAPPLKVERGKIVFDKVTFHYLPNHAIFENKSLTIKPGEKIGLVGFSGSGKTTFVNLILRYFDLESGRILIDGQDIAKVSQESLRSQISMIPQDAMLFHRSLMDNIRYGRLDATDEEVIEASKQAHCHEFINRLPEKYQTLAGERGVKLSGGQRQRIALARVILKNAPILILDEATSALDSVTERLIQDTLHEIVQGKTTLAIAHRLSTLSDMDRILVFKKGKIVESGSHEKLLSAGNHYAKMWQMQAGGFLPDSSEEEEA